MDPSEVLAPRRPRFERLATTPGQERVILEAIHQRCAAGAVSSAAPRSPQRRDGVQAFRADSFDVAVLGDAFAG
ncbi:MAG: hypothetical protein U0325_28920 [Polyangiales bacterium]